jgi:hypothetical protein
MLLGFLSISIFVDSPGADIWELSLLLTFLIFVIFSVFLEISALWARIPSRKTREVSKRNTPLTFFNNIAVEYPVDEKTKVLQGKSFFNEEIRNNSTEEQFLRALAVKIVIFSSKIRRKYILINVSYSLVLVSIGLMSSFTIFRFWLY